tara:strand:+ start:507 stop:689 length:183 start_codon:yes stop_codon:yes gene_type:complete
MDHESETKLLASNVKKLEKLIEDLTDSLESKTKKVEYLKDQISINVKKIDQIIQKNNADS